MNQIDDLLFKILVLNSNECPMPIKELAFNILKSQKRLNVGGILVCEETFYKCKSLAAEGKKINAIKVLRSATNLGLKEAKDAIDKEFYS